MARLYHPDMNPAPEAKDIFISITEAYEFLLANHIKVKTDQEAYAEAMEDWRKYRQHKAHRRAAAYAHTSYSNFQSTILSSQLSDIPTGCTILFPDWKNLLCFHL